MRPQHVYMPEAHERQTTAAHNHHCLATKIRAAADCHQQDAAECGAAALASSKHSARSRIRFNPTLRTVLHR